MSSRLSRRAALAALLLVSAASPPASRTYTIAANGTAISVDAGGKEIVPGYISRVEHCASPVAAVSDLRFIEANWYFDAAFQPADGSPRRVEAWLEYPAGRLHPIRWQGRAILAIGAGGQATSDPVATTIPAGARFWTRWRNAGEAVARWPLQVLPAPPAALGRRDGVMATADRVDVAIPAARDTMKVFGPAAILGIVHAAHARGGVIVGDSIAFGSGDVSSIGSCGGSGYPARAIDPLFAYTKMARGGQSASDLAHARTDAPWRFLAALPATDAFFEHGINDLRLGRTPGEVLADQRAIRARAPATARQWQTTLTPRTSSRDGYRSVAGQTAKTDGTMTELSRVNAAIRHEHGPRLSIIDVADAAMSGRDSNVWSGPWPPVLDGTHPTSAKAAALATAVRADLQAPAGAR